MFLAYLDAVCLSDGREGLEMKKEKKTKGFQHKIYVLAFFSHLEIVSNLLSCAFISLPDQ